MLENPRLGAALVVLGVVANNYVYLHDLMMGTHQGMIQLGWIAGVGVFITIGVITLGLYLLLRSRESSTAE